MRGRKLARYNVEAWRRWHQSRNVGGQFGLSPRCQDHSFSILSSPSSANMADEEREARAAALASQALELVASGRDEVRRWPYSACYLR